MIESKIFDIRKHAHHVFLFLNRRRLTILTFLSVTLLVIFVSLLFQSKIYQATATILIDQESPSILQVSTSRDDATVAQTNYLTYADYYRTQLEYLKSYHLAEQVFTHLNLKEDPGYANKPDAVNILRGEVTVEPVKQTRIVKLSVENVSPKKAAQTANEFAAIFVQESLMKAASSEALTLMKTEYLKLQSKEAELSKRYREKYPARARIRQQIKQLEEAIGKALEHQAGEAEPFSQDQRVDLETLLKQLGQDMGIGGYRPSNIRIQDLAQVPLYPIKPQKKLMLALGFVFGLLGGLALAVLEEMFDNTLKFPQDIEQHTQLPFLGHVPHSNDVRRYPLLRKEIESPALEAYRNIRTNLIYCASQNENIIVVTSPGSGEGKSTTASNLGVALSQLGIKVLIVDADLRKPRLHEIFNVQAKPGLSEVLSGQAQLDEVIRETEIPGLFLITSGTVRHDSAELLGSAQMRELLKEAAPRFDRILLDAPPIIAVTDSLVLAALTGAVLGVVQSGKTPREALNRLASLCASVNAKLVGVILNNVPTVDLLGYGYGYSSYPVYGVSQRAPKRLNDRVISQLLEWKHSIHHLLSKQKDSPEVSHPFRQQKNSQSAPAKEHAKV